MKSLGVRCLIANDMHELYEIDPTDQWGDKFPWRLQYYEYGEIPNFVKYGDHPENWYWVPIARQLRNVDSIGIITHPDAAQNLLKSKEFKNGTL